MVQKKKEEVDSFWVYHRKPHSLPNCILNSRRVIEKRETEHGRQLYSPYKGCNRRCNCAFIKCQRALRAQPGLQLRQPSFSTGNLLRSVDQKRMFYFRERVFPFRS